MKIVLLVNLFAATATASMASDFADSKSSIATKNDNHKTESEEIPGLRGRGRLAERQLEQTKDAPAHEKKNDKKRDMKNKKKIKENKKKDRAKKHAARDTGDPEVDPFNEGAVDDNAAAADVDTAAPAVDDETAETVVDEAAPAQAAEEPVEIAAEIVGSGVPETAEAFMEAPEEESTLPRCPTKYNSTATYSAGDIVELNSHIFACLDDPYEEYCNIAHMDESWDDETKGYWEGAWDHVEPCAMSAAEEIVDVEVDPVPVTDTPIDATDTTTDATPTIPALPTCPPVYDPRKTDYVAGDAIELREKTFVCHSDEVSLNEEGDIIVVSYEQYCNAAEWDGALFGEIENAKDLWSNAWVLVGACSPTTHMEVMEEEAIEEENIEIEIEG